MADEKRRAPMLNASRVLKIMIYVGIYLGLRYYDEITQQNLNVPALRSRFAIVNVNPEIPHWRRQLWRAFFSLPMVIEEEGRRMKAKGQSLYRDAEDAVSNYGLGSRQSPAPVQQPAQQVYDAREAMQYQQAAQPAQRQVYDARDSAQYQQDGDSAASGYPGLAPGEKLLYVAPPGQAPGAVTTGGRR